MIDNGMSAVVNAPYSDPKAPAASAVRDENAKGGFDDALGKVKDDGQKDRFASDKSNHASDKDETQGHPQDKGQGTDAETAHGLAARKLLEAMAMAKSSRENPIDVEGLSKELQDATKAEKSVKKLESRSKDDKKTDLEDSAESKTSAKSMALSEIDPATLAGLTPPQASAENPLDQIARAINNFASSDEPVRGTDNKNSKAEPSVKADIPALGINLGDDEAATDADAGGGSTFRFSSSKSGSARSVDMTVSRNEGRAEFEVRDPSSRAVENVTVLDSRRFIGLAPSTNASALTGLIAGDREWVSAMHPGSSLSNAAAQSSTGKVVHTLKLHLTPIDLGSVTMSLRMVGEELAVHMTVENNAAFRKLQDDNKSMLEALKAHGLSIDNITISIASSDKSDQTGTQSNNQQNQSAQQNDQQMTDGRNRDESGASDSHGFENRALGGRDDILEGSVGRASSDRDNGVYL